MITRGAHYTALLNTIDHQGATKLHAREREQLKTKAWRGPMTVSGETERESRRWRLAPRA
jgi:hypothetical protein